MTGVKLDENIEIMKNLNNFSNEIIIFQLETLRNKFISNEKYFNNYKNKKLKIGELFDNKIRDLKFKIEKIFESNYKNFKYKKFLQNENFLLTVQKKKLQLDNFRLFEKNLIFEKVKKILFMKL